MVTKPTIGQNPYGTVLNAALDQLEADRIAGDLAVDIGEEVYADVMASGATVAGILNTPVSLDGLCAIVPPSDRPQEVRYEATFAINVAGAGYFTLQLYDYTNGAAALKSYAIRRIEAAEPTTAAAAHVRGSYRMDPHNDYRVMQVFFTLGRDVGSSLAVNVPNFGNEYTKRSIEVVKL